MTTLDTSYRGILKMVLPIMFGMFTSSVVLFIDAAFMSRVGTIPFDAVGNASLVYITLYMTGVGLSEGGQIIIARRLGETRLRELGRMWQHTLASLVGWMILLFFIAQFLLPTVLGPSVQDSAIREGMFDFLGIRSYGLLFGILHLSANSLLAGTGKTSPLFISTLIVAVTNIVLDYVLIFGEWGAPEMGLEGAALASVIAEAAGALFLFLFVLNAHVFQAYELRRKRNVNRRVFGRLFRVASPLMFQGFLSVGGWTFFFMMIEHMGPHELEVSQVVHKLYFLALIPIVGFNAATKTYVSNQLAQHDPSAVLKVVRKIILMNLLVLLLLVHGNILYPEFWIRVVSGNPDVLPDATKLLGLITGSIAIHGVSGVLLNAISGAGKTHISMFIEIITILVYMFYTYMSVMVWDFGLTGVWAAEYVYFVFIGILSLIWFSKGKWVKQRI